MFSHIFVSVSDFARAQNFYTQVLSLLGIQQRLCEADKPWAGWHSAGHARPYFVICHPFNGEPHEPGNGQMVAFTATSREQVRSTYQKAIDLGARCEGAPGLRPQYHDHYYGAYFRDLDGNKICVACHHPEPDPLPTREKCAMRVLAISGSLRAASINTAFLRAVISLSPNDVQVSMYQGMNQLPIFNPDLESAPPAPVQVWRDLVAKADALIIASPEYAHGITGAMKNALDWLVSYEPFVNKPVAVINTSERAHHADAALRETLSTMNAQLVGAASIMVPLLGSQVDLLELPSITFVKDTVAEMFEQLQRAVHTQPKSILD